MGLRPHPRLGDQLEHAAVVAFGGAADTEDAPGGEAPGEAKANDEGRAARARRGRLFGYMSPMLLQLKTGQVTGYNEGQEPLIYLVTKAQTVGGGGGRFVFSDGHGLAKFTAWFDDVAELDKVDWGMVYQRYWADSPDDDMDRQRRKQAEFLVHRFCPWDWIEEIGVLNQAAKARVEGVIATFPARSARPVLICPGWYYP